MRRWRLQTWAELAIELRARVHVSEPRPVVVGVDGRSGNGKTTVAERLALEVPSAVVLHTDDLAWWESFFGWDGVLAAEILLPVRRGGAVTYTPPAWQQRGRPGCLEVPAGTPLLIVEGVGSTRASLRTLMDVSVWVQADAAEATRRGLVRDGEAAGSGSFWEEWQAQERPFLEADRPWDRADLIVCGTPEQVPAGDLDTGALPAGRPIDHAKHVLTGSLSAPWSPQAACRC